AVRHEIQKIVRDPDTDRKMRPGSFSLRNLRVKNIVSGDMSFQKTTASVRSELRRKHCRRHELPEISSANENHRFVQRAPERNTWPESRRDLPCVTGKRARRAFPGKSAFLSEPKRR